MLRRKDAFEKWLVKHVERLKCAIRKEVEDSERETNEAAKMQHSVMRVCYESGRDLLNEVLAVYRKFKKGEKIDEP